MFNQFKYIYYEHTLLCDARVLRHVGLFIMDLNGIKKEFLPFTERYKKMMGNPTLYAHICACVDTVRPVIVPSTTIVG